jgi:hypothetical protein
MARLFCRAHRPWRLVSLLSKVKPLLHFEIRYSACHGCLKVVSPNNKPTALTTIPSKKLLLTQVDNKRLSLPYTQKPATGPLSWDTRIQSTSSHTSPLESTLILSAHVCLNHPSGLIPSGFSTNPGMYFFSLPYVLHARSTFLPLSSYYGNATKGRK